MEKKKKEYLGTPINTEILAEVKGRDSRRNSSSKQTNNKNRMIAKYGASGIVKNDIPELLQSPEIIEELEKIIADIKKYGNVDSFSFIPAEVSKEIKDGKKIIKYLIEKKSENSKDSRPYTAFPEKYIFCRKCGGFKHERNFYTSMDKTENGYLNVCKDCLKKMVDDFYEKYKNLEYVLLLMCLYTNCIFNQEIAQLAIKNLQIKDDDINMLYTYYRIELSQYNNKYNIPAERLTFEHSNFSGNIFKFVGDNDFVPVAFFEEQNVDLIERSKKKQNEIVKKWGPGFTPEEYDRMEALFNELSKFKSKKNIIQTNALVEYVRLKVKLDGAIGKGELSEIEKWQKLTDSAAKNAGIKLDQLTAEDFGEGVDSWTTLVELVEEYDSVIPIMPKMKKMPYDDIDFIIWEVVNYCRRLMELPEINYEDVWKYIDERFVSEMKRRGYDSDQIRKEKRERNAVFKELGDNYVEPLWLNPNLEDSPEEDEEDG